MKTLLLASDSFKGTLSSLEIASIAKEIIENDFRDDWSLDYQLIADGGEGTLDAFEPFWGGKRFEEEAFDAERKPNKCPFLLNERGDALIEVASIIGLPLIKGAIPPLERTTKGLGVLIKKAIALGARKIYVGLGGSSTNDMGIGMLRELGVRFRGVNEPTMANASQIVSLDASGFFLKSKSIEFICLCDVSNPLLGKEGATYAFGRQKGYGDCLSFLESGMSHLCSLYEQASSKTLRGLPSLGAAGGLAAALYSFMDAKIESGIAALLSLSHFEERAEKADLIITGEGCFDGQSLNGKAFSGISSLSPQGKLIVLCGQSKVKIPGLPCYEISEKGQPVSYLKERAKEDYARALRRVLLEHR